MTNQGKNENEDGKSSENEFDLWIFHIKIRLYGYFHENLRRKMTWKCSLTVSPFNSDYLPEKDGKKFDAKNEDDNEKI